MTYSGSCYGWVLESEESESKWPKEAEYKIQYKKLSDDLKAISNEGSGDVDSPQTITLEFDPDALLVDQKAGDLIQKIPRGSANTSQMNRRLKYYEQKVSSASQ